MNARPDTFTLRFFGELNAMPATRDQRRNARECYALYRGRAYGGRLPWYPAAESRTKTRRLVAHLALFDVIRQRPL